MKATGLFSWLKVFESSFFDETLKLALVWFDHLVMQSPRGDIVTTSFPTILAELGVENEPLEEICKAIHPVQDYFPDYKFAEPEVWAKDPHISQATETALTRYFEEKHGPWPERWALMREVALGGCGVIDAIYLVSRLSADQECFMLPTDFEHKVLAEITKPADPRSSFDLFHEVARYRLPAFKDTSWNKIIELRHHPFAENFREALSTLQSDLRNTPVNELHEAFVEIERKLIRQLLSLVKPSVFKSTIKGIATNLPLPLPVNPLGIADTLHTIYKNKKMAEQFGWLYFLYDLD